jgi:Secretion system C-terminal sorting domain
MKKYTFILILVVSGYNYIAAQTAVLIGRMSQPLTADEAQALGTPQNGTQRSLIWKRMAARHDIYDDTTSLWIYTDSLLYGFDVNTGAEDSVTSDYYVNGNWVYLERDIYSYDNLNQQTYVISNEWDTASHSWIPYMDFTFTHNAQGKLTSNTMRYWNRGLNNWRNSNQYIYTFDANNNQVNVLYQNWDTVGNAWVGNYQYIKTYDANNKLLTQIKQLWNTGTSAWDNSNRDLYTNNANGYYTSWIQQIWVSGAWRNYEQILQTYNGANKTTEQQYQGWDTTNMVWNNIQKYDYTYDANNNVTSMFAYGWNQPNISWQNSQQIQYTYVDINKKSGSVTQNWSYVDSAWVNVDKDTIDFDGNFNAITNTDYTWNSITNVWVGNTKKQYTYDINNNQVYELDQNYNLGNLTFQNTDQRFFYYMQVNVATIDEVKNQLPVNLYPNPSNGSNLTLSLDIEKAGYVRVGLYDALGKLVTTSLNQLNSGNNNLNLNYNTFSAGVYYIQVLDYSTGKSSFIKFVKQ